MEEEKDRHAGERSDLNEGAEDIQPKLKPGHGTNSDAIDVIGGVLAGAAPSKKSIQTNAR